MSIEKIEEFAKDGERHTRGLNQALGFPKAEKPERQWFNELFYKLTSGFNAVSDAVNQVSLDISNAKNDIGILKEKTLVVESIADLSTIKNPKDGLRVYVKSYHAGFGVGGGYFTYDSSKSGVNDGGTVFGGWERDLSDGVTVTHFGAKGDGSTDDTAALQDAIDVVRQGGSLEGYTLKVPKGKYKITASLNFKSGVSIVGELVGTVTMNNCAEIFCANNSCFNFSSISVGGYVHIENLKLTGVKKGGINIANKNFGNVALDLGDAKGRGRFENLRVEGFDVGICSYTSPGLSWKVDNAWGGAYRHFNYLKLKDNTYNVIHTNHTTDSNYFQCDFRTSTNLKTNPKAEGFIYIYEADDNLEQSASFVDCMFENMGHQDKADMKKWGFQIVGPCRVKIIGGYAENCAFYVGHNASLVTSINWFGRSTGKNHAGEGLINVDHAVGVSTRYRIPDFDYKFPVISGSTTTPSNYYRFVGVKLSDSLETTLSTERLVPAYKFSVTEDMYDSVTNKFKYLDHYGQEKQASVASVVPETNKMFVLNEVRKRTIETLPVTSDEIHLLLSIEYKAPVGKSVNIRPSPSAIGYYGLMMDSNQFEPYSNGWVKATYTASIKFREDSDNTSLLGQSYITMPDYLAPTIVFPEAAVGDEYFIRSISVTVLCK